MPEIRIIATRPHGRIRRAWDNCNYYGDKPSQKIIDFCGKEVINKLESVPLGGDNKDSTKVYFERDGIAYHVYKGINKSVRIPGRYGYNVYRFIDDSMRQDAVSSAVSRACRSKAPHDLMVVECNKSNKLNENKKVLDYPINTNNRQVFVDPTTNKEFTIIDDSYVESELPLIEAYNDRINEKSRIHLDAMFEFGIQGGIDNALLLVLNSNCGYDSNDSVAFMDPRIRAVFADIRKDKRRPYFALSKELRSVKQTDDKMFPMCGWWDGHIGRRNGLVALVKGLIGDCSENKAIDWLSCHFAAREFYCYHSKAADINVWLHV